ncbi:enoyl-CoA hydratase/isomerase family protein [Rhizobium sp. KVB221]|uniref:3-hydroxyisobutyryl-CoA hydrolase n=1 Tax=Rhizobium setariae TaxID=2801340 RepID=A0A936YUP0_9HYPH|nr:enoyl-CoA hydratase/isomerase family protein [Rhizobium setariae]MBL0373606.1 enoyl-CoA hydratase/isomerase family protein [Rhizobium setariae]
MAHGEPEILISRSGSSGHIRLNRPKALNSLTLAMVRDIDAALDAFAADPEIAVVVLTGEGERGLCAGGDIRAIHQSGKEGSMLAEQFWREEYRLNARIAWFPKPYVAIMDGIVMGGGVGLSSHASHRVVTDRTRLAMPETGIGFFPDVGASWLLSRPGSEWGTYLGLTGTQIGAADAIAAGLADWNVNHDRLEELLQQLSQLPAGSAVEAVDAAIDRFSEQQPLGATGEMTDTIERAFSHATIEEILAALEAYGSTFAAATRALLLTKSPVSLKVTLKMLLLGRASATLEECLAREFAATPAVLTSHDFYEGVRAAVIDKDRNPHWRPATLAEADAYIDAYFTSHPRPLY